NLVSSGSADLTAESLNMKVSAIFNKAFSDKVGTTRAGGVMNVALTNSAGELVLPALLTRNFQHAKFAPDLETVAEVQKQKFIPTLSNPTTAIGNILDAFGKKKTDEKKTDEKQTDGKPADGAAEKPSVVKGILDILGGPKAAPPAENKKQD